MSFLVQNISRTQDGREIIRGQDHDKREIHVGRAASCEVHLADLAVELHHARLTLQDGGMVEIAALSGLGFDVDGVGVMQAHINPADGAELRFGSHILKISRKNDVVNIRAERAAALSGSASGKDEMGLFTLRNILPGRRLTAWALSLILLLAFLIWPVQTFYAYQNSKERPDGFHADTLWSSGPLSSSHAGLGVDCQSCHNDAFVAVRDDSCRSCHKDVHDHADAARLIKAKGAPGILGQLSRNIAGQFNRPEGRCVECHSEHEGDGPMVATRQQFCTSCHDGIDKRLDNPKIANAADFGTDHPEFKVATNLAGGKSTRISLLQKPADNSGLKFPHDIHVSTKNGVARMASRLGGKYGFGNALDCKDCHIKTADAVRFQPVNMERNCAMCHSLAVEEIGGTVRTLRHGDPKMVVADLRAFYRAGGPFMSQSQPIIPGRKRPGETADRGPYHAYFGTMNYGGANEAIRSVFSKGGACFDCHKVGVPPAGSDDWEITKVYQTARYMENGWFDHDAHKTEKCSSCHMAKTSTKATDLLVPGIKTCRNCHGGEGSKSDVPSSCAMCHDYHMDDGAPWEPKNTPARRKSVGFKDGVMAK